MNTENDPTCGPPPSTFTLVLDLTVPPSPPMPAEAETLFLQGMKRFWKIHDAALEPPSMLRYYLERSAQTWGNLGNWKSREGARPFEEEMACIMLSTLGPEAVVSVPLGPEMLEGVSHVYIYRRHEPRSAFLEHKLDASYSSHSNNVTSTEFVHPL